ncbi:uncharacterized protein LOC117640053 [Thrips palmi]|uniref:Uncharacterized protein LOC117640053 n=1 Tax=Thrips palmi TaxID=161013 RepID=A0A6P8XYJ8_THRPL|nr:uncharacterized protein LOC117640053 [Thrips palmi]
MKLLFHGIKLAQRTYNFPSSYFVGYINNMLLMKRSHETWPSIRILNTSSLFSLAAAAIKHRNNIFLDSKFSQTTYNNPFSYFMGYSSKILPIKRSQETWPSIRILNTSLLFSLAAAATNFHGIKLAQTTYNFPSYFVVYFSNMLPMKRSHLKIEGQNLSVKII